MKYQEALDYLEALSAYNIMPGHENIGRLSEYLGNPQEGLKFVHITGINGDGSAIAYVSSILKCAGYRVGQFSSSFIFDYREKIQVNERPITQKAICQGVELIQEACEKITAQGYPHPTSFEVEMALVFRYFKEKQCDIVVLETDSLWDDVVQNIGINIIRSISMDQTAAGAKATSIRYGLERQRFRIGEYKNLEIGMAGKFQVENAVLALETVKVLTQEGYPVKEEAVRQGLAKAKWQGSFNVIGKKPFFVVDGAHDEDSARKLADSIECYFPNKRIIYIMGVLHDSEYEKMIALTHKYADQIITVTPPRNLGGLEAYDLAVEVARVHPQVTAVDSLEEALEISRLLAGKEDVILAFGSLSYLGKLIKLVKGSKYF